ncbi:MAG: hypothetical protein IJY56_00640 [Clostridia bacterium]|nr:hypothetical protein [Clostridia bacterium]
MKHFAKSLVSVVIALSILATMCVIGVSASAEDTKTYLISAKTGEVMAAGGELKAENYLDSGNGSYGGTAVIRAFKKMTDGVDVSKTTITAWIWVEDASTVQSLDIQFSSDANSIDTAKLNFRLSAANFKTGWNTFVLDPSSAAASAAAGTIGYHEINGGGTTVLTAIKLVRVLTVEGPNIRVGAIYVTPAAPAPAPEIDESEIADFAPADKAAGDYLPTKADKAVVSVVDVSTLTGGKYEGTNKTAYKVDFSEGAARKEGVYTSLENPVRMKSAGAEKDYTFEAWIWAEKEVDDYIFQFYADSLEQDTAVNANHTEKWVYRISNDSTDTTKCITLKAGWNHVKVTLDSTFAQLGSSSNPHTKDAYASFTTNQIMTGFSIHDNADNGTPKRISLAIADAKFYKTSAYKEPEKDANKVGKTIISANVDKKADDMTADGNATNLSVVKTSELKGGTSGVPSEDAYKFTVGAGSNGLMLPVVNTDWTAVNDSTNADGTAGKDYGVNAWVYISDASKVNALIFRFFDENNSNWNYQVNKAYDSSSTQSLVNGWNNITFWFPNQNRDHDHAVEGVNVAGGDGKTVSRVLVFDYSATGGYDFAIACARLITRSDDANAGWTVGSATGDATDLAVVVVAILLAAMAASVTVCFGKKAR